MKINPGEGPLLTGDRQITVQDLDIVLTGEGIAMKGYIKLTGGGDDAETAAQLSALLSRAAAELAERAPSAEKPDSGDEAGIGGLFS